MKPALESDVSTLDGILHALYEVLSGPAGQPRDWERYRSLFLEGARLIVVVAVAGEKPCARQLTVEDYIRRVEPIFAVEDFWKRGTGARPEPSGRLPPWLAPHECRGIRRGRLSSTAPTACNCSMTTRAGGS